jgi:hypothetical protein
VVGLGAIHAALKGPCGSHTEALEELGVCSLADVGRA